MNTLNSNALNVINSIWKFAGLLSILAILLLANSAFSASISISGNVFDNGAPANNIMVVWEDSASRISDTTYTDSTGYYSLNLNTGSFTQGSVTGQIVNCSANRVYKTVLYNPGQVNYTQNNFIYCSSRGYYTGIISGNITNVPPGGLMVSCDTIGGAFPNSTASAISPGGDYSIGIICMNQIQDVWVYITDCNQNKQMQKVSLTANSAYASGVNFNYCNTIPPVVYSGTINLNNVPVDSTKAFALRYEYLASLQNFQFVDTLFITGRGKIEFPKDSSEYLIKVMPWNTNLGFLPTYYPSGITWDDSNSLAITNSTPSNFLIDLVQTSGGLGENHIVGKVHMDSTIQKPGFGAAWLMLIDKISNAKYLQFPDSNNFFKFQNIVDSENYELLIDQPGIPSYSNTIRLGKENRNVRLDVFASSEKIETTWSVGYQDYVNKNNTKAYPNPFLASINIKAEEDVKVEIYSINGAIMYSDYVFSNETKNIETYNWQAGMYIMRVKSSNYEYRKRIIKTN